MQQRPDEWQNGRTSADRSGAIAETVYQQDVVPIKVVQLMLTSCCSWSTCVVAPFGYFKLAVRLPK